MFSSLGGAQSAQGCEIETKEIRSWQEFQEIVAGPDFQNWAFRGQSDADWPLFCSLSRYLKEYEIHPEAWMEQERRIGRIFKRKAHLFLDHVPSETDAFRWLALMQHHGAPTRLLDFTWSPFVAAFFALERATRDAAVWAIFVPATWKAQKRTRFHSSDGISERRNINLRHAGVYEECYLGNDVSFVFCGEPVVMNKRLVAQSGTFVVPGVLDRPIEEIISAYPKEDNAIVKFVLKTKALRNDAMRGLYNMNLTNATLFPDLDGLAKSMAYELEFHWRYDPKTMQAYPGY